MAINIEHDIEFLYFLIHHFHKKKARHNNKLLLIEFELVLHVILFREFH